MVGLNSLLALSAFGMGALAHPAVLKARATTTATSSIPSATAWDPPSSMVTALDQVWNETLTENSGWSDDKNWIFDQLMANNGDINYCVRWNTDNSSTAAQRTKTASALQRSLQKWVDVLIGFDGFNLTEVNVNVVGYAVKDKSLLEGDTSNFTIYTDTDSDGVPMCDDACYRGSHLDGDLSGCSDKRWDISLWLDESLNGELAGYGYNWGEELPPDYFFETVDDDNVHILLHEMGHGFGLLDFYDWTPSGQTSFIMMAGSAFQITEFDAWMLRDWWRRLKTVRGW